jgi:hypothetical protein
MNLRRQDGDFDYGGFSALVMVGISVIGIVYALAIRPIEEKLLRTEAITEHNREQINGLEISKAENAIHNARQYETLDRLASAVNNLANQINTGK